MSNIPATLKYTESHEWVQDNGDGTVTIGNLSGPDLKNRATSFPRNIVLPKV